MRRLLLIAVFLYAALAIHGQDVSPGAKPGPAAAPSAAAAPGTVASSGAPTVANPAPAPAQPIAFSHKTHAGQARIACDYCHAPSRNGETLALPQAAKCMTCHAAIATDKPAIKMVADAAKNNQVLQWVRVYRVPSFVSFSHKIHTSAGAGCEDCHGPVAQRDATALEKDLSMGGCISCHTQKGAPTGCDTCHQLNSVQLQVPRAASNAALLASLTYDNAAGVGPSIDRFLTLFSFPRASSH